MRAARYRRMLPCFSWLLLALLSCGSDPHTVPPDAGDAGDAGAVGDGGDGGVTGTWTFTTLETRQVLVSNATRPVELVRASRPDGGKSYLLYVHAAAPSAPVVIWDQPYDGIDWTGEEVDTRWAALGNGAHPDSDAPNYNGNDTIGYALKPVETAVGEATPLLANGFAVVIAYGRYYAGGSLEDDILDATAPYHFTLSRSGEVDVSHVGSLGGSWGGMMALFGASRAPSGVGLRMVVPMSPPSDFVDIWQWAHVHGPTVYPDPAKFEAFYSPYLRRVVAATNPDHPSDGPDQWPDAWARYRHEAVCEGLGHVDPGLQVLIAHDQWDVLIPVQETVTLSSSCSDLVRPLYWPRDGAIPYATVQLTHGPFATEETIPVMLTLAVLDIALALAPPPQPAYSVTDSKSLESYLSLLRASQQRGESVAYATAPLRSLCDPRTQLLFNNALVLGASALSTSLNNVYGTATTAQTVCSSLANGLPSP